MPGRTSCPFINDDIRLPLFSADVLKKCALIVWLRKKEKTEMDVMLAKLGRKTKVCLLVVLEKATWATMRCTSSGCMGLVTRSLFSCWIRSWQRWHATLANTCSAP